MFFTRPVAFIAETFVDATRDLTSKEEMKKLFGVSFYGIAISLIMVLLVWVFFLSVNHLMISLLRLIGNFRGILLIACLMTLSTVILSYYFMYEYDLLGVAPGWLIGQAGTGVVGVVLILLSARRNYPNIDIAGETAEEFMP